MAKNQKKVARLHAQDPTCYWCGEPTIIGDKNIKGKATAKTATLDHVFSKVNPLRALTNNPTVLACNSCNKWRARIECAILSPNPSINGTVRSHFFKRLPKFVRFPFPGKFPLRNIEDRV